MAERGSLTAQLQQAWLRTQMPKGNRVSPPVPSPAPAPAPAAAKERSASMGQTLGQSNSFSSVNSSGREERTGNGAPEADQEAWTPSPGSVAWAPSPASYDGSGSMRVSDAVSSPVLSESTLNTELEGWDVLLSPGPGHAVEQQQAAEQQLRVDPTFAYFAQLLADQGLCKQKHMLVDCTAYQAVHNELADLIGDVTNRLEFTDGPLHPTKCPNALVENWLKVEDFVNFSDNQGLDADEKMWSEQIQEDGEYLMPGGGEIPASPLVPRFEVPTSPQFLNFDGAQVPSSPQLPSFNGGQVPSSTQLPSFNGGQVPASPQLPSFNGGHVPSTPQLPSFNDAQVPSSPFFNGTHVPSSPQLPSLDGSPGSAPDYSAEDVTKQLLECAQAVNADDVGAANALLGNMRQFATPWGSGLQRLAHYFVEALGARLSGTGADLFTAACKTGPAASNVLRAYQLYMQKIPHFLMSQTFGNRILLDAFEGAERVHIIDYGILYGHHWPSFMQALANRPGGPPKLLRITGIEFPQSGLDPVQRVKETGIKLGQFAERLNLPFEYKAIADKWENVHSFSVNLRKDEVLAVTSMFRLHHLLDESVLPSSPRRTVLERVRSMKPKVFVTGVVSAACNVPFYNSRFVQAFSHYLAYFEALDVTVPRDSEERHILEKELLGRDILNIVACEGLERIERAELYTQWKRRILNAGFQQVPVKEEMFKDTREVLRDFHENFGVGQDEGWVLMGWKETVQSALSAWQPK